MRQVAEAGCQCRGGDSLNEPKEIHLKIGESNVTLTFKGYNPNIKQKILGLLCDSFEERVMKEAGESDNDVSPENEQQKGSA